MGKALVTFNRMSTCHLNVSVSDKLISILVDLVKLKMLARNDDLDHGGVLVLSKIVNYRVQDVRTDVDITRVSQFDIVRSEARADVSVGVRLVAQVESHSIEKNVLINIGLDLIGLELLIVDTGVQIEVGLSDICDVYCTSKVVSPELSIIRTYDLSHDVDSDDIYDGVRIAAYQCMKC